MITYLWLHKFFIFAYDYAFKTKGEPNDGHGGEKCVEMYQNSFWNDDNCAKEKPFVCEKSDKSQISIPEVVLPLSFNNGNLDPCPAGYSTFGGGFSLIFLLNFINLTLF